MEETNRELFEKVVKVAQARGFVFNASSISVSYTHLTLPTKA